MERRLLLTMLGAFCVPIAWGVNNVRQDMALGRLNLDPKNVRLVSDDPQNTAVEVYNYFDLTWSGRNSRNDTIDQRNDYLRGIKPYPGPESSLAGWLKTGIELESIGFVLGREGGYKPYQHRYSTMRVFGKEAIDTIRGQVGLDGLRPYFSEPDKVRLFYIFERYTQKV